MLMSELCQATLATRFPEIALASPAIIAHPMVPRIEIPSTSIDPELLANAREPSPRVPRLPSGITGI